MSLIGGYNYKSNNASRRRSRTPRLWQHSALSSKRTNKRKSRKITPASKRKKKRKSSQKKKGNTW